MVIAKFIEEISS